MVPDTSSPASGESTPGRPISVVQVAPSTIRAEDPLRLDRPVLATLKPVATSQQSSLQAARPDKAVPISHLPSLTLVSEPPKVTSIPAAQQPGTHPGMDPSALSNKVLQMQEEMDRAMGDLLTTRVSMGAYCRKQVLDVETTFHQNEVKAIKEMRTHCMTTI